MRGLFLLLVLLWSHAATAQECFRDQIGLDPVQPTMTSTQWNAGLTAASQIVPRLGDGTPSASGKINVMAMGHSNTDIAWKGFIQVANQSGLLRPNARLINGAFSGVTADRWANPNDPIWARLIGTKLANLGLTPQAIAVVFLLSVNNHSSALSPAEDAGLFKVYMRQIRVNLTAKGFTNRKIDYIGSNMYGGYDVGQDKSPEPYMYYEGLTLQQLQDEATGPVWVSAINGYSWADGTRPRPWDGFTALCPDYKIDGVHPNKEIGQPKHGWRLFDSFRADPTTYGVLW